MDLFQEKLVQFIKPVVVSIEERIEAALATLAPVTLPTRQRDLSGINMSPADAKHLAAEFIDAAPEDAMSADEYDWSFQWLTRQDLEDTGLLKNFAEHARNISLDPAKSDLSRPVVVSLGDGEVHRVAVWDGVHRIMSALDLGHDPLPAVVGKRKMLP